MKNLNSRRFLCGWIWLLVFVCDYFCYIAHGIINNSSNPYLYLIKLKKKTLDG